MLSWKLPALVPAHHTDTLSAHSSCFTLTRTHFSLAVSRLLFCMLTHCSLFRVDLWNVRVCGTLELCSGAATARFRWIDTESVKPAAAVATVAGELLTHNRHQHKLINSQASKTPADRRTNAAFLGGTFTRSGSSVSLSSVSLSHSASHWMLNQV